MTGVPLQTPSPSAATHTPPATRAPASARLESAKKRKALPDSGTPPADAASARLTRFYPSLNADHTCKWCKANGAAGAEGASSTASTKVYTVKGKGGRLAKVTVCFPTAAHRDTWEEAVKCKGCTQLDCTTPIFVPSSGRARTGLLNLRHAFQIGRAHV